MKKRLGIILILLNTLLVMLVINGAIHKKQSIVDSGKTVFLKLAPVDPRSLMQGDYMVLRYALPQEDEFRHAMENAPTRGRLLLEVDQEGVASFSRRNADGEIPRDNEVWMNYRKYRRGFRFGIESFFFQEGFGDAYQAARMAEIKVSSEGEAVLVDLRSEELKKIQPVTDK